MKYLIWSNEHNSWWAHNHQGYTDKAESAGRYSHKEALEICNGANYSWDTDRITYIPNELPIAENIATDLLYNRYKKKPA